MDEQAKLVKKKIYKRWWFWALVVLILIIFVSLLGGDQENRKQVAMEVSQANDPNKTPEERLESQVKSLIKKTGTTDVTYRGVDWDDPGTDRPKGSKMPTVKIMVDGFWDRDALIRDTGILSSTILQTVYATEMPITDAIVWYYGKTKDRYGNEKEDIIISMAMPKITAQKINWNSFSRRDLCDFLKSEGKLDSDNVCVVLANIQ